MQLLGCRIEGFGKLVNFEQSFREGINGIEKENGWGKSTLATFIRVMFFGFEHEGKRDDIFNERRRYFPWDRNAVYGGSLWFRVGKKHYRIERYFDEKKPAKDRFFLYDEETKLKSDEYSENIGEELFEIDRESFRKTIFIGQKEIGTEATARVSAKIGDISDLAEDLGNYEEVERKIKEELNAITPERKTGELKKIELRLEELYGVEEEAEEKEKKILEMERSILKGKKEIQKKEKALEAIREKMKKESLYMDEKVFLERQKDFRIKKRELEEEKKVLGKEFKEKIPTLEEINSCIEAVQKQELLFEKKEESRLMEYERKKMKELKEKFLDGFSEQEEIPEIGKIEEKLDIKKKEMIQKREWIKELEREDKEKKKRRTLFFVLGWSFLFVGVLCLFVSFYSASFLFFMGLGFLISGIFMKAKNKKKIEGLEKEVEEEEEWIRKIEKEEMVWLEEISLKEKRRKEREKEEEERRKEIDFFFLNNGIIQKKEVKQWLIELRDRLLMMKKVERMEWELERKQADFLKENGKINFMERGEEATVETIEELNEKFHKISEERKRLYEEKGELEKEVEREEKRLERLQDAAREKRGLLEKREELQHRYEILKKTKEYLEKAKNRFVANYVSPIQTSFNRYYRMMTKDDREFESDANLSFSFREREEKKDILLLSEGYQTMVGMGRRVAMIDAMYKGEKPFLVMDDPFVNLDEKNLQGAKIFLEEISKQYQILYFYCHESRKPKET